MSSKDVDKRVTDGLLDAMKKARGNTERGERTLVAEAPHEAPKVFLKEFSDTREGKTFSECFGIEPPRDMPDLRAPCFKDTDWPKGERAFIPTVDDKYVPNIKLLYQLWVSVLRNNKKALVVGPTGSGKSSLQKYFCAHTRQPIFCINGRGDMESDSILGKPWVSEGSMHYEKGELVKAAEKGWWIVIDEPWKMPAPIQMALQRFYEKDGQFQLDDMVGELEDKLITTGPTCRLVLCDNVVGTGDSMDQYAATMIQDGSTLNRMDVVLKQDYMLKKDEIDMITLAYPDLAARTAGRMVDFITLCRTSYAQRALSAALSPRNLLTWAELAIELGDVDAAASWIVLDRYAEDDERALIGEHYNTVFDTRLRS